MVSAKKSSVGWKVVGLAEQGQSCVLTQEGQGTDGANGGGSSAAGEKWRDLDLSLLFIPRPTSLPESTISTWVSQPPPTALPVSGVALPDPFATREMLSKCRRHHVTLCLEPIHCIPLPPSPNFSTAAPKTLCGLLLPLCSRSLPLCHPPKVRARTQLSLPQLCSCHGPIPPCYSAASAGAPTPPTLWRVSFQFPFQIPASALTTLTTTDQTGKGTPLRCSPSPHGPTPCPQRAVIPCFMTFLCCSEAHHPSFPWGTAPGT